MNEQIPVGGRFVINSTDKSFNYLQMIIADISYDLIAKTLSIGFYELESLQLLLEEWIKSDHSKETITYSDVDKFGNMSLNNTTFSSLEVLSDIFSNNYYTSNPPIRKVTLRYDNSRRRYV
jgi:hypothetical protein